MTALFAWGANSHGQLGLGFVSEQVLQPTRVDELPDNLCETSIRAVVGGGGHTFLLTSSGKLYGAGWNDSGQVGNGTQLKTVTTFELIRGLEDQKVVKVACGWSHSVALSSRGQVWVWGSNSFSQLGLPEEEVPFSCLPICLNISDVVSVAAGLRYTVVATKEGRVYSWGQGHRGQLGHIDLEGKMIRNQSAPRIVEPLDMKVATVACSQNTTYAVTIEGQVLAWGDNKWGQLAHDPTNVAFFSCPLMIPSNYLGGEKALWLEAGWTHCAVGLSSGAVCMWGRSDYGQIGPSEEELDEENSSPKLESSAKKLRCRYVPNFLRLEKIKKLSCGSEHNLVIARDSDNRSVLYAWGWNEHGNCGDGSTQNIGKPTRIPLQGEHLLVGAGSGHSFALVNYMESYKRVYFAFPFLIVILLLFPSFISVKRWLVT